MHVSTPVVVNGHEIDLGNIKSTTPLGSPTGAVLLHCPEKEEGTISVVHRSSAVSGVTTTTPEGAQAEGACKTDSTEVDVKLAEEDPTQSYRVLFGLQNMLDVSKTLQPGYQIKTTIGVDMADRYMSMTEEEKNHAYYFDVHHPLAKHKVSDKMSEKEVLVRMQAQLDKIPAMAKSLWWHEKITVKSVRDPGDQLRLIVSIKSDNKLLNVPTSMLVARAEREAKAGGDQSQFGRFTSCIENALDLASTLLPGYQVTATLTKDTYERYSVYVTESKHADYHSDVKTPPPGKSPIKTLPRGEQFGQLKANLAQILIMSKKMNSSEPLTFTIGTSTLVSPHRVTALADRALEACDSHRNLHLRTALGNTKRLLSKDALGKAIKKHEPQCSRNSGVEGAEE